MPRMRGRLAPAPHRRRPGWTTKLAGEKPQRGNVVSDAELAAGQATKLAFKRDRRGGESRRFTVRCLPADFPAYSFERKRPGGAKLFMVQLPNYYAAIFDGDGVPVWWKKTDGCPRCKGPPGQDDLLEHG